MVIDVQTHLVDPALWVGPHAGALGGFLRMVDPDRWPGPVDPRLIDAAAWATLVFGGSETAVALLTSTPGPAGDNVDANDMAFNKVFPYESTPQNGRNHQHHGGL